MCINRNNLFNPYSKSDLGFFITEQHSEPNEIQMNIEDIDLYYQPVENPVLGFVFLLINAVTGILGEIVQFRLYKMVTKENGLVKETTQLYVLIQMIGYPIIIILHSLTDFIYPLSQFFGSWFCIIAKSFVYFYLFNILQHSLIAATMRYLFIVHENWVEKHGKAKVKQFFLILTICMPILMVAMDVCDEFVPFLGVSRCSGTAHENFLKGLLELKDFNFDCAELEDNELFPGSSYIRKIGCIIKIVLFAMIGLNVVEGLLYFAIFVHIKR